MENTLLKALVLSRGTTLSTRDFDGSIWGQGPQSSSHPAVARRRAVDDPSPDHASLAEVERAYVQKVLFETDGNKSAAARLLEVSRPTLNRMIKDHHLVIP
jgi:DNA-binding NtrC family response regulator